MANFASTILFVSLISVMQTTSAFAGDGSGGGSQQWRTNGNKYGDFNSAAMAQAPRLATSRRGANFQSAARSNGWQKNGSGGGGGGGGGDSGSGFPSQYQSKAYDTGDKYGYDYTIPGANVHFAAFRTAGASTDGAGGSDNGSDGWNDYARKRSQGRRQHGQTSNGGWQNKNSPSWRNAGSSSGSGSGASAAPLTW